MRLNADFSKSASVTPEQHRWVASPQRGVERVMLDRVGNEVARATSLVRYAPSSRFPPHQHADGEEILVLSGAFSDEAGRYPAGWYLRNPPGSAHQPFSDEGALIFVKLRQMSAEAQPRIRIDTRDPGAWRREPDGSARCPLFENREEQVCLRRLEPAQALHTQAAGGIEILLMSGELLIDGDAWPQGSWIRLPAGARPTLRGYGGAATLYLKTGHLATTING